MRYRFESNDYRRSFKLLLTALGLTLLLFACSSDGPKPTSDLQSVLSKEAVLKQHTSDLNAKLFASAKDLSQPEDYVLREGDLLQVSVYGENDLASEARVGGEGTITLPLVGSLKVTGLSAKDAEQRIQDAYEKKYLRDPRVRIFVKEQHGSKITLLGQLNKPGTYDYYSHQRLMSVLSVGGGLSEKAGGIAQVSRNSGNSSHPDIYIIDLDKMINEGEPSLNMEIEGGDVIYVPPAGTVYVDGAVKNPGTYPIKTNMTIQEVLVAAGGLRNAQKNGIKLARLKENGDREILQLSLNDIRQGNSANLKLKDHDVIFAEQDKFKSFISNFRVWGGNGLMGLGWSPMMQ